MTTNSTEIEVRRVYLPGYTDEIYQYRTVSELEEGRWKTIQTVHSDELPDEELQEIYKALDWSPPPPDETPNSEKRVLKHRDYITLAEFQQHFKDEISGPDKDPVEQRERVIALLRDLKHRNQTVYVDSLRVVGYVYDTATCLGYYQVHPSFAPRYLKQQQRILPELEHIFIGVHLGFDTYVAKSRTLVDNQYFAMMVLIGGFSDDDVYAFNLTPVPVKPIPNLPEIVYEVHTEVMKRITATGLLAFCLNRS